MPAESVRLQWKSTILAHIRIVRIDIQVLSYEIYSNLSIYKKTLGIPEI